MERITRLRAYALLAFFLLIITIFAFRLYDLQIIPALPPGPVSVRPVAKFWTETAMCWYPTVPVTTW